MIRPQAKGQHQSKRCWRPSGAARDKAWPMRSSRLPSSIPKAMAYQMIASRFHQKVGNQEEAALDAATGNATSWEEIG